MKKYLIVGIILSCSFYELYATVRYIKPVSTGTGNGDSWANASSDLQQIMDLSSVGDEVWVAAGTYIPSAFPTGCGGCGVAGATNRNNTFFIKFGIKLIGGFNGTESSLSQRDFNLNETILSGDIGADNNTANNAYHVVTAVNCNNNNTFLERLTIKNGNANGVGATITVQAQTYYQEWGGGVLVINSNITIKQSSIVENNAISGGGMLNTSFSVPKIENSVFAKNTAQGGAGIYNHNNSSPIIVNCTIAKNTASITGAAMYNLNSSNPSIEKSIIWGNNSVGNPSIANNGSTPLVSYSIVAFGFSPCTNCPTTDGNYNPLFENMAIPVGPDNKWGTYDDGLRLSDCSIGIDFLATSVTAAGTDITNRNRAFDVPFRENVASSCGLSCDYILDIGAYENQSASRKIIYVNNNLSTGSNDGSSWANAFRTNTALQDALNLSCLSNEIWVASGTYKPTSSTLECIGCSGSRDYSFFIREDIRLIGGFNGTETNISESNPVTKPTILSGDVGDENVSNDNCNNVLLCVDNSTESAISGFNIINANANGSGTYTVRTKTINRSEGGGMLINEGNMFIYKCNFKNNLGNGLVSKNSGTAQVIFSEFSQNSGIGFKAENNSAALTGNIFKQNGNGAINLLNSNCDILSTAIVGNSTTTFAGGIYTNGGFTNLAYNLIEGNSANSVAGGVSINGGTNSIWHNTIARNSGLLQGGGIYINDGTNDLKNNIFWKNSLNGSQTATGSDIFLNFFNPGTNTSNNCMFQLSQASGNYVDIIGSGSNNVFAVNPLFTNENDADGPDSILRTPDDGFYLKFGSPAINNAANTILDSDILMRIEYNPLPSPKDVGAYEFIPKGTCIFNRHIADRPIEAGTHISAGQITSNGTVNTGTPVIMDATQSIILLPGFETQNNAVFRAKLGGCSIIF